MAHQLIRNTMFASSLFLTACVSVGPDFEATELSETRLTGVAAVDLDARSKQWWLSFDDPVLDELIDLAISNNFNLKEAQANVDAAFAQFKRSSAAQFPTGGPVFNYSDARQVSPGFSQERSDITSYQLGAQGLWNLDLFGKLRRGTEAARANAEAQAFALNDLHVAITAQVAQTYAELRGVQARIEVTKKNIDSMERMRTIVNERFDVGFASELDFHRIEAQLYGVKATLPVLSSSAERYKNTLIALVGGKSAMGEINLDQFNTTLPSLNKPFAIGNPQKLLRQRADIYASEKQLEAATANIGVQTASLYPDLSVSGFIGFLSGDFSSLGDSQTKAWSIAPSISWSIFNLNAIRANIDIANHQQQAALARFQQTILNALSETESALSDYVEVQKQRHLLEAQVRSSKKALDIAQLQYEAGAIDLFQVLDIERNVLTAQDNLIQSQFRTFSAIVQVYVAFGGGFEF